MILADNINFYPRLEKGCSMDNMDDIVAEFKKLLEQKMAEKLQENPHAYSNTLSNNEKDMYHDILQEVAYFMYRVEIIDQPELSCIEDDRGILNALVALHTGVNSARLRNVQSDIYLQQVGTHTFGTGVYLAALQDAYNRPISAFSYSQIRRILYDIQSRNPYQWAMKRLGVTLISKKRLIMNQIILTAIEAARRSVGPKITELRNTALYMQALYNAGITMLVACS